MHDPFDPYWQWLAIPPAEQPPHHYRILGLRLFETDRPMVARAARARIEHVRSCHDGSHPEAAERVLAHLAAARDTLLSPELKAQYDNLLVQRESARVPQPAAPPRQPTRTSPVNVVAHGPRWDPENRRTKLSPTSLIVFGMAAALALALGLALWSSPTDDPERRASSDHGQDRQVADTTEAADGPARQQAPSRPSEMASSHPFVSTPSRSGRNRPAGDRATRSPSSEPRVPWRPRGPETMADLMSTGDDTAIDVRTVTGRLAAARRAMWSRDLAAARRHVEAAVEAARTPTERTEVERVRKLFESLEAFWGAVHKALGQLESGRELRVGDSMAIVVEARREQLTVRAAGRISTYRIAELPQKLAVALAQQVLPKGQPTTDLHVGSFLAVDVDGDRHEARTHWDRAGADGKDLLLELALALPVRVARTGELVRSPLLLPDGTNGASLSAEPDASVEPPPAPRRSVPDDAALARAERLIQELFQADIDNARTGRQKRALAEKLFDIACQTDNDPAAHYVMCRIVRDLAVDVGDPDPFCRYIDEMDRRYEIDALGMKAAAFTNAWRSKNAPPYRTALARQSLQLLDAAVAAKHYPAAAQLVRVAEHGAKAAKDYALAREIEARARQIEASLQDDG
ncbi:MAG TPA: hypothetical protein VMY37_21550 [Thermoguttaceae bacterium]|nr:hypothetical protein [Thermoguttaceae bacterium]